MTYTPEDFEKGWAYAQEKGDDLICHDGREVKEDQKTVLWMWGKQVHEGDCPDDATADDFGGGEEGEEKLKKWKGCKGYPRSDAEHFYLEQLTIINHEWKN